MAENKSVFETLNAINVNDHTEKKNGLTYLSWAWAWAEVKKHYPEATYKVYERWDEVNYFTDGKTCWVKTGVTIEGVEHIEYLPVMDYRNRSITLENVTSFDVNKAIQRSLTKACARHGLGLYIYAGEDLPEEEKVEKVSTKNKLLYNVIALCADEDISTTALMEYLKNKDSKLEATSVKELPDKYLQFILDNFEKISTQIKESNKDVQV